MGVLQSQDRDVPDVRVSPACAQRIRLVAMWHGGRNACRCVKTAARPARDVHSVGQVGAPGADAKPVSVKRIPAAARSPGTRHAWPPVMPVGPIAVDAR